MKKINIFIALSAFIAIVAILIAPSILAPNILGPNYKNVTVWTHVNITHSRPEVLNISIYESLANISRNITVNAGGTKRVYCNATLRSWDGFNNINYVNATLFFNGTSNPAAADNNNTHYTNSSCWWNESITGFIGWYVCSFDVYYYANNGTWGCNVSVSDTWDYANSGYNTTIFYPVYALNVTDGIDFGGLSVYDYSNETVANVTNFGNMAINVTVEGYGAVRGDGLAMNCTVNGNISVTNEHFSLNSTGVGAAGWNLKDSLTGSSALVKNLTMPKQTIPGTQIVNSTYWQLFIPPNPAGNCTGWVIFTAMAP